MSYNDNEYLLDDLDDESVKKPSVKTVIETLNEYVSHPNINELLEEDERKEIVDYCLKVYREDCMSMQDWLDDANEILDFMSTANTSSKPAHKAKIKLPMISTAVNQLSARIKSELVKNGKTVRYKVIGGDVQTQQGPDGQLITTMGKKDRKGKRITKHLNWQLMDKIPNYSVEVSKLVMSFAALGTAFTKTYYDITEGVIRSEFIPYDQLILNHSSNSLEDAEMITHKIYKSTAQIIQCQRHGYFTELADSNGETLEVKDLTKDKDDHKANKHKLLELHCWLDLDHDGLPEPYVVTIHEASEHILRIVARFKPKNVVFNNKNQIRYIKPTHYFNDYICLQNPDGGFWGNGIGSLLINLNDAANSMINILTDAGHLATMQGGFLDKNLRIPPGLKELSPGEWIRADASGASMKDGIVPFNYKEPSAVLFQVLGLLLEQAKAVSATSDLLSGQSSGSLANVSPNVIFSLMENGLQVYSAVTKSLANGKRKEIQKIVDLNAEYLNPKEYLALVSPSPEEIQEMFSPDGKLIDYDLDSMELQVLPVVDVNESTEGEKQIRSQAMFQAAMQAAPTGVVNMRAVVSFHFDALGIENSQQFIAPEQPAPPDPKMIQAQAKSQLDQGKLQIEGQKLELEKAKIQSTVELKAKELEVRTQEMQVQAMTVSAQNELAQRKLQREEDKTQLDVHKAALSHNLDIAKLTLDKTLREKEISSKEKISQNKNKPSSSDGTLN